VLWIQTHFFRIRIHNFFSVSDSETNIFTPNFSKWCLLLLSCLFWNLYVREKNFSIEKQDFLFQVFAFWFFIKIFILQQCLNPNPYPNPSFFSDSDPAKTIELFRIRFHNTVSHTMSRNEKKNKVQGGGKYLFWKIYIPLGYCLIKKNLRDQNHVTLSL
jgi:hypothetical protein